MPTPLARPLAALALAALAACASTPEAAPPPDITGVYTFTTTVQGMTVNGQMRITGEPGSYGGALYSDVTGELSLSSVDVTGDTAVMMARSPDGPVEIRLRFAGETIAGTWALGPEGGSIRGRRVRR